MKDYVIYLRPVHAGTDLTDEFVEIITGDRVAVDHTVKSLNANHHNPQTVYDSVEVDIWKVWYPQSKVEDEDLEEIEI